MNAPPISAGDILDFWFGPDREDAAILAGRSRVWFGRDASFDASVRERFGALLARAARDELRDWDGSPAATLALIIVHDQFPRNVHRSTPGAFALDRRALALCRDGVATGIDARLAIIERAFFYLPLEHAEDGEAQAESVRCYARLHSEAPPPLQPITARWLAFAHSHYDIIERFGRFPHRNLILGRHSTAAEVDWLATHRENFGQG